VAREKRIEVSSFNWIGKVWGKGRDFSWRRWNREEEIKGGEEKLVWETSVIRQKWGTKDITGALRVGTEKEDDRRRQKEARVGLKRNVRQKKKFWKRSRKPTKSKNQEQGEKRVRLHNIRG